MPVLPIMIDCDPGVDDAIALLLALTSPELEVLGITTVAGNVAMKHIQRNARQICELAGRPDMKVFAGCPRPLMHPLQTAEEVHGVGGLAGMTLPEPTMPLQTQHGIDFLVETLEAATAPITLATLGPLTNVAIALIKAPHIATKIERIVLMGGSTTFGNITASAEFNIYVDPHAAHVVFTSGIPLTMLGLNVTHTVLSTPTRRDRLRACGDVGAIAAQMLDFYGAEEAEQMGLPGSPLHDPCVIAYLIQPDLFTGQAVQVDVEIASPLTLGRTVVDFYPTGEPNATVITHANADGFYDLLTQRLSQLGD